MNKEIEDIIKKINTFKVSCYEYDISELTPQEIEKISVAHKSFGDFESAMGGILIAKLNMHGIKAYHPNGFGSVEINFKNKQE